MAGEEDEFATIGEERKDWQKSAFPLPWTDLPDVFGGGANLSGLMIAAKFLPFPLLCA